MDDRLRVLLVEPWFGGSHRGWAKGLRDHSRHDVEILPLPGEGWRWRMRGAAITLAERVGRPPDVVLASSLLDVSSFLGHARRAIGRPGVVLYMHENQLTYPLPEGAHRDMALAFVNWSSMVAADRVAFNSGFHRDAWFEAVPAMVRSMPPPTHEGLIPAVEARSSVVPVGVEMSWLDGRDLDKADPPLLIWNQRWEHDKDPDALAGAVRRLVDTGLPFRMAICGRPSLDMTPPALDHLAGHLGQRLVHFGHADRTVYESLLAEAAVVVSTARHEFFGVAVVEAMAAGARPVLPDRLSYPGLVPEATHDRTLYRGPTALVEMLTSALSRPDHRLTELTMSAARRFDWRRVVDAYDTLLREAAAGPGASPRVAS